MKRTSTLFILILCLLGFHTRCAFFLDDDGFNPLQRQTENNLPVFYIHPVPASSEYCPGTLYYRGREYEVETKIHGATTKYFPMKSYTIKFNEDQLFSDPEFNLYNKSKIILITSFNDNSFIRNRLALDIWQMMDSSHIKIKTYNAVVYLSGKYRGLYTVCEKIDGNLINEHGLYRDGNLYKGVNHDADFFLKENPHLGFKKEEGCPEHGDAGAYADLDELVTFISSTDPDDFNASINTILNQREYEDWWMFITLMTATDSCDKNAFHYHNPENGVWRYIPWDFNASFGQNYLTKRVNWTFLPDFHNQNNIFKRFFEDDEIRTLLQDRFADLLSDGNALAIDRILSKIDEYLPEIREAAIKSEKTWREKYRNYPSWKNRNDFNTFEEEIQYIKEWLTEHHSLLIDEYDR
ncbi:MAG: CotH kinase family protein [Spirochaetales bacterium]|nr:CotH kinase family protein [Spirochaetales bacterium]